MGSEWREVFAGDWCEAPEYTEEFLAGARWAIQRYMAENGCSEMRDLQPLKPVFHPERDATLPRGWYLNVSAKVK